MLPLAVRAQSYAKRRNACASIVFDASAATTFASYARAVSSAFTFSIEVDIVPEFELPSLDGIKILKPLLEVEDKQVDDQLEKIRVNEGELTQQEAAESGDYCIGNGKVLLPDGEEAIVIDGAVIQIPAKGEKSGAILGLKIDDFAKQVGSPKAGDSLKIKTTGPDNHENEDIRGKKLEITFDVEQVQRIVPASMEDVLAKYGMSEEAQLREGITLRLNQRIHSEQQAAMRQQVVKYLLDQVDFELPERLTSQQAAQNLDRQRAEMMYRGVEEDEIEKQLADIRSQSDERASRDLKVFFLLAKIAQDFEIQVSEQDIGARIIQMASERGMPAEKLRDDLIRHNQIQAIGQQIREHKAIDQLVEKADVEEVSAEDYRKKVAPEA